MNYIDTGGGSLPWLKGGILKRDFTKEREQTVLEELPD